MKTIVRNAGNIGPFDEIEILADRLRCYRNGPEDYPFSVIGVYTISDDPDDAPTPIEPVTPVPDEVTNAQAREALIRSGISIASVNSAIQSIANPVEREVAFTQWEYRDKIRRNAELVKNMGVALNLSDSQIDDLFRYAITL